MTLRVMKKVQGSNSPQNKGKDTTEPMGNSSAFMSGSA